MYCQNAIRNIFNFTFFPFDHSSTRQGFICVIEGRDGKRYYSEASPLPGFSTERSDEVLKELQRLQYDIKHEQNIDEKALLPSVHFAMTAYIGKHPALKPQRLNGLVRGSYNDIRLQSMKYKDLGYTHLKVKIENLSFEEIYHLVDELSSSFTLRLDANRKFSFSHAEAFFSKLEGNIEYIEEPTYEIEKVEQLSFPIALDETLRQLPFYKKKPSSNIKAFILKPTMTGGFTRLIPYIEMAEKYHIKTIFSSSHESGIGLMQIISIAQSYGFENIPQGLDTCCPFNDPVLQEPLNYEGAMLLSCKSIILKDLSYAQVH